MNYFINDTEVLLDGDQPMAVTFALNDLLDPASIRAPRSTTIRVLNTPASRSVLGSEAMAWNGKDARPVFKCKDGGVTVFESEVMVMKVDRNVMECAAVGGNASWFEWAKKTKLREYPFGNSPIINEAYMTGTWTDREDMLYFGLYNLGSIAYKPNTYDVPLDRLRPSVRVHRALSEAFKDIGWRINPKGALAPLWKRFVMFHPTDELSREIPELYLMSDYVSGPTGWFVGGYFVPPATFTGTVELENYTVGFDPFEPLFDGATFSVLVYDFTDQTVLAELILPPAELGGTLQVDHLFTNVRFIEGHQIGTAVQMHDLQGAALTISTGGPVSVARYSDGVDTLAVRSLSVAPIDLTDASRTGTFVTGTRMSIAAAMPDLTVMDLLKGIINAQRLVAIPDVYSKTVNLYFEDEFLRPLVSSTDVRVMTTRLDHTAAPSKVMDQQPTSLLLKWKDDSNDRLIWKTNKIIGGEVGYGNGLAVISRGTKPQQTIEIPFAATVMAKVFGGLLVPSMNKEAGVGQDDTFDFEDRLLIEDGMRDGTWKLEGVVRSEYPYAYFANDRPVGYQLAFDNATIYGDTRPGTLYTLWGKRINIMRNSNVLECGTFWNDHELADFDHGKPTVIHDGTSAGIYYVQEIKDHRFGRSGTTKTVYVQTPTAADQDTINAAYS